MTTINEMNKVQINYTVRRNSDGSVTSRDMMINVRVDSVQEAYKLYEELKLKLNGELAHEEESLGQGSSLVVFEGERKCPHDKSELVLRTARKGKNIGAQFYSCPKWPSCTYHENL